jgi:hypothetical protein
MSFARQKCPIGEVRRWLYSHVQVFHASRKTSKHDACTVDSLHTVQHHTTIAATRFFRATFFADQVDSSYTPKILVLVFCKVL